MCGSTRSTTSPSSSSTRRNTPCAAGCCGPKLMVKLRISVSAIGSGPCLTQGRDARGLRFGIDARVEFVPGYNEAVVCARADCLDAVVRLDLERHAPPIDFGHLRHDGN